MRQRGEGDLAGLAAIISSRSTSSKADCYGVSMALSQALGESLSDGKIVRVESLGTFSITRQGTAADAPQPLGKTNIKRAKIVYHPAKDLKNSVKKLTLNASAIIFAIQVEVLAFVKKKAAISIAKVSLKL